MALKREPQYPSRRTYVVKARRDARPDALGGRLENLVTAQTRTFASGHELLESIADDVQANGEEREAEGKP